MEWAKTYELKDEDVLASSRMTRVALPEHAGSTTFSLFDKVSFILISLVTSY